MKKIILTVAAVFALSFANAQDKKASGFGYAEGDIVLGGNIKFGTTDNGTTKNSNSAIAPDVAYFITDKFAVELGIGFGNTKTTTTVGTTSTTTKAATTNIAVGGRYYFLNLGERFKTYTSFGLNFGSNDNGGNGATKTSTLGVGAGLGMNYFLTPKIAINFGLGNIISYDSSKTGSVKTTGMNVNLNEFSNFFSTPTFGVSYKL